MLFGLVNVSLHIVSIRCIWEAFLLGGLDTLSCSFGDRSNLSQTRLNQLVKVFWFIEDDSDGCVRAGFSDVMDKKQ